MKWWQRMAMALVGLLMVGTSSATILRIATLSPDGSAWMQTLRAAAAQIKQRTAGRVDFRFYTGGSMGNDNTVLSKVRIGELAGGAITLESLAASVPDTQLYSLPMLFQNQDELARARRVMDPVLAAELAKAGWQTFGFADGGFVYIMSSKAPIANIAQLRQHKVWIPEGDRLSATALRSFQVTPVPLSLGDVLPSLQSGIIDVVAGSPIATLALQWQTQVRYLNDLPMSYMVGTLAVTQRDFQKLTAADQQVVRQVMNDAFRTLDQRNRQDGQAAYRALLTQGVQVVHPDAAAHAGWKAASQAAIQRLLAEGMISASGWAQIQAAIAGRP